MVEIMEVPENKELQMGVKHENDESYKTAESGISTEGESSLSVVCKEEKNESSGYDSKTDDFFVENGKMLLEIFDLNCFNPPIYNSSNIDVKDKICDISTIENDGLVPKSVKGNNFTTIVY